MAKSFPREKYANLKYGRLVSSIAISVVLLTVFVTWDSWMLLSRPSNSIIPIYFYGAADVSSDLDAFVSQEGDDHVAKVDHDDEHKSEVEVSAEEVIDQSADNSG